MKKIAWFTHYGSDPSKSRQVQLSLGHGGTYTVTIEGYPDLTIHTPDRVKAESALRGWWEMSQKDWGASEIIWEA